MFEAYDNRGRVYADIKNYHLAIQDYTKAIELDPDHACGEYGSRGLSYLGLHDRDKAKDDFIKACNYGNNSKCDYNSIIKPACDRLKKMDEEDARGPE